MQLGANCQQWDLLVRRKARGQTKAPALVAYNRMEKSTKNYTIGNYSGKKKHTTLLFPRANTSLTPRSPELKQHFTASPVCRQNTSSLQHVLCLEQQERAVKLLKASFHYKRNYKFNFIIKETINSPLNALLSQHKAVHFLPMLHHRLHVPITFLSTYTQISICLSWSHFILHLFFPACVCTTPQKHTHWLDSLFTPFVSPAMKSNAPHNPISARLMSKP